MLGNRRQSLVGLSSHETHRHPAHMPAKVLVHIAQCTYSSSKQLMACNDAYSSIRLNMAAKCMLIPDYPRPVCRFLFLASTTPEQCGMSSTTSQLQPAQRQPLAVNLQIDL